MDNLLLMIVTHAAAACIGIAVTLLVIDPRIEDDL